MFKCSVCKIISKRIVWITEMKSKEKAKATIRNFFGKSELLKVKTEVYSNK